MSRPKPGREEKRIAAALRGSFLPVRNSQYVSDHRRIFCALIVSAISLATVLRAVSPSPAQKRALPTVAEDPTPIPRMPVVVGARRRTPVGTPGVSPQPSTTPTPTPTSTSGLPGPTLTPTLTPTDSPAIVIRLRAVDWQWDFYDVPGMADGGPDATLKLGQTYELHVFNGGIPDTPPHRFSGNSALGISGFGPLEAGGPEYVVTFRPSVVGAFSYICSESTCGVGHDGMQGLITVLP